MAAQRGAHAPPTPHAARRLAVGGQARACTGIRPAVGQASRLTHVDAALPASLAARGDKGVCCAAADAGGRAAPARCATGGAAITAAAVAAVVVAVAAVAAGVVLLQQTPARRSPGRLQWSDKGGRFEASTLCQRDRLAVRKGDEAGGGGAAGGVAQASLQGHRRMHAANWGPTWCVESHREASGACKLPGPAEPPAAPASSARQLARATHRRRRPI